MPQLTQVEVPHCCCDLPGSHSRQAVNAVWLVNVPGVHDLQMVRPVTSEYEPNSQPLHDGMPVSFWAVPVGHAGHTTVPIVPAYRPYQRTHRQHRHTTAESSETAACDSISMGAHSVPRHTADTPERRERNR
jgi:hypothetical protein